MKQGKKQTVLSDREMPRLLELLKTKTWKEVGAVYGLSSVTVWKFVKERGIDVTQFSKLTQRSRKPKEKSKPKTMQFEDAPYIND